MIFAGIFNLGGGEIVLILAIALILVGAKKLPEFGEGLRMGFEEFVRQTREVTHDIQEFAQQTREVTHEKGETTGRPFLLVLTIILGVACLILALYEFSK